MRYDMFCKGWPRNKLPLIYYSSGRFNEQNRPDTSVQAQL